jgi:hypothetical protein
MQLNLNVMHLLLLDPVTNHPENEIDQRVDCIVVLLGAEAEELGLSRFASLPRGEVTKIGRGGEPDGSRILRFDLGCRDRPYLITSFTLR